MESDLVYIYSAKELYYAELIHQMLTENSIHSFIINKQDSAYKFGEIEIYVHRDDVIKATKLIKEFEEN